MSLLRGQLTDIVAGSIFLFIGLAACSVGLARRQDGMRTLTWLGVWSAMYGAAQLSQSPAILAALPHGLQAVAPGVSTAVMYLLLVAALLAFRDLSLGGLRTLETTSISSPSPGAEWGSSWPTSPGTAWRPRSSRP